MRCTSVASATRQITTLLALSFSLVAMQSCGVSIRSLNPLTAAQIQDAVLLPPTQLAISASDAILQNACALLSISQKNSEGGAAPSDSATSITLSRSGATGTFYFDSGCSTSTTTTTISSGQSVVTVYFQNSSLAQTILTASTPDLTDGEHSLVTYAATGNRNDFATGNNPRNIAAGDFDGDGKSDLAVISQSANEVHAYLGNGDATFKAGTVYSTGTAPESLQAGDLDGDGNLDIVVVAKNSNTLNIKMGIGDGTFIAAPDVVIGGNTYEVAIADIDGDGNLDLISPSRVAVQIYASLGNGDGTFGAAINSATIGTTRGIIAEDFDSDGIKDIVVAGINAGVGGISFQKGNGDGTFGAFTHYSSGTGGTSPHYIIARDLDSDGDLDVVGGNLSGNSISVFEHTGTAVFSTRTNYATGGETQGILVEDFNGDGFWDIAALVSPLDQLSIFPGTGPLTFGARVDSTLVDSPKGVATGDFDGDLNNDIATANVDGATFSVIHSIP